jgi:hypothetical protein
MDKHQQSMTQTLRVENLLIEEMQSLKVNVDLRIRSKEQNGYLNNGEHMTDSKDLGVALTFDLPIWNHRRSYRATPLDPRHWGVDCTIYRVASITRTGCLPCL